MLREVIEFNIDYKKKIFIECNFLCVEKFKFELFFREFLNCIINYVKKIFVKFEVVGFNYIVFVGGFVELKYI